MYATRSQQLSHSYWIDYCKAIFSPDLAPPAIGYAKYTYGDTSMRASNIVFNNAIEDPWQYAGMREIDHPYQADLVANLIDCTDCAHCVDIHVAKDSDA